MKSFLVALQLNYSQTSYGNLIGYLKSAPRWANVFENTWIIKADIKAGALRDGIKERLFQNDRVLVIEVPNNTWGTFNVSKEVTDWMHKNL
jgi:hypothetical protein